MNFSLFRLFIVVVAWNICQVLGSITKAKQRQKGQSLSNSLSLSPVFGVSFSLLLLLLFIN